MVQRVDRYALFRFLQSKRPEYAGKVIELREAIAGWLSYIPQTFPHYTRHTIEHSEQVISQSSNLLFVDGDPTRPVVDLSGVEAYSLIAASLLHDAGMVTSDHEKIEILRSEEWKDWAERGGGGTARYAEVKDLRESSSTYEDVPRDFIADIQLRFLIAEFVRKTHHLRTARLLQQREAKLARFAFDDPVLAKTIGDICKSHGLLHHELQDSVLFPDRRTVRGELLNVKFLSLILRLADLLDMSSDRACPLLLNAASPLPSSSLAHWSQYRRITHRLVAHDRVELRAECLDQAEHRFLQDWCSWLVEEVEHARATMAHSLRHNEWVPPFVSMHGPEATIHIKPSTEATYVPSKWTLKLDPDVVIDRLIHDLHSDRKIFLRELIQNALDATRCRILLDSGDRYDGYSSPFLDLDASIRQGHAIEIEIEQRQVENPLSGEEETRQILTIVDSGIGMDRRIIEDYLLQIGRSFYTSDEFRRDFGFFASSQFGIGFLSVFAVSDHVELDTFKAGSDDPIRIVLTGPRNYLLSEHGTKRSPGTSVSVLLREEFEPGELTALVSGWCKRVEFPIRLNDLGVTSVIKREVPGDFEYSIPDITQDGSQFSVVSFPIERKGIDGELYVFVHSTSGGDSWADWNWARYTYPTLHPEAAAPPFPGNLVCINGISVGSESAGHRGSMAHRLDFRHPAFQQTLTRTDLGPIRRAGRPSIPEVESRWQEVLSSHLQVSPIASGEESWTYKQRLVERFDLSGYWEDIPGTVAFVDGGRQVLSSLNAFVEFERFCTTYELGPEKLDARERRSARDSFGLNLGSPLLAEDHIGKLSTKHRRLIFESREVSNVALNSGSLVISWIARSKPRPLQERRSDLPIEITSLPFAGVVGFSIHKTTDSVYPCVLLNGNHALISWLLRVRNATDESDSRLGANQYRQVLQLLLDPVRYSGYRLDRFITYLQGWADIPDLPHELYPPEIDITRSCFSVPGQ